MKTMIKFSSMFALLFTFWSCSSSTTVSNNYRDGIYDADYDDRGSFDLSSINDEPQTPVNQGTNAGSNNSNLDYYNPEDNSNFNRQQAQNGDGTTIVNNYYGPSLRQPGFNSNFYWNSWGGWGFGFGTGFYDPWLCDPFFYDPWFSPVGFYRPWGWGGGWGWGAGWGRPWGWRGAGWHAGFGGYNSYWAGYYHGYHAGLHDGFYHGGGGISDGRGRNVVYTGFNSAGRRSSSAAGRVGRDGRTVAGGRSSGKNSAREARGTYNDRRTGSNRTATRTDARSTTRNATVSSRFARPTEGREATTTVRARSTNTRPGSGSVSRSYSTRSYQEAARGTTPNATRRPNSGDRGNIQDRTRSVSPSRSGNYYSNDRSGGQTREQNPGRTSGSNSRPQGANTNRSATPERSQSRSSDNMYVPRSSRNRNFEQQRQQNTRPSYGGSRNASPSRSSGSNRSATPSRSSGRSRGYSPSRSSGSSRGYSPSRSSGGSRSASPSRSSGGRSSGGRGR